MTARTLIITAAILSTAATAAPAFANRTLHANEFGVEVHTPRPSVVSRAQVLAELDRARHNGTLVAPEFVAPIPGTHGARAGSSASAAPSPTGGTTPDVLPFWPY